jgi:multidrug efflux system outer membrane protein
MFAIAGCAMGPNYQRPPIPEPEAYREEFPSEESIADLAWWEVFGDTILVDLIDMALEGNQDLAVAMARIDEARAALGIVRSDLFPRVDYVADGSVVGTTAEDGETSASALVALNASYQVDLWGRIRRANEAAVQELLATEEAYRGVTIALVAEVANSYLLLRDLDNRLQISEQTVEARRQTLDVVESRFNAGVVSEVDLSEHRRCRSSAAYRSTSSCSPPTFPRDCRRRCSSDAPTSWRRSAGCTRRRRASVLPRP